MGLSLSNYFHFNPADPDRVPVMYRYPRLAIVEWDNHRQAAFHPRPDDIQQPLPTVLDEDGHVPDHLTSESISGFVKRYLRNPDILVEETEHF